MVVEGLQYWPQKAPFKIWFTSETAPPVGYEQQQLSMVARGGNTALSSVPHINMFPICCLIADTAQQVLSGIWCDCVSPSRWGIPRWEYILRVLRLWTQGKRFHTLHCKAPTHLPHGAVFFRRRVTAFSQLLVTKKTFRSSTVRG